MTPLRPTVARTVTLAVVLFGLLPAVASAQTFTVSSSADSGPGSLRADVAAAGAGDTIVIPGSIPTITLTSTPIAVAQTAPGLTIQGAGASATAISGGNALSIFSLGTNASLALTGVTVTGGSAGTNDGGAILGSTGVMLTITNSAFTNNQTAGGDGEAIELLSGSTLTITGSTFSGNGSTGGTGDGGAIHMDSSGTLTITNSTFANNHGGSSSGDGGAIQMNSGAMVTVTGSTFSGNHAGPTSGYGGAMQLDNGSTLTVTNSTLAGNAAGASSGIGGAIEMDSSAVATILNATITGNQAIAGGGVSLASGSAGYENTILANNVAPTGANCSGATTDHGNNDETGTTCGFTGTGDLSIDPALGPLQDNGGPTQTEAPLSGSPVIDAGTNTGCPSTDQRGFPRPSGARCDIGAVEQEGPHTLTATVTGSGSGSVSGSGIACPGTCSMSYPFATAVSLSAAPAKGSKFAGWGGACTGAGACNVTMNADQSVTATFTRSVPVPPRPKCTLTLKSSKFSLKQPRKGHKATVTPSTLALTARCDQAVKATLSGVLTELVGKKPAHGKQRTKTFHLGPLRSSLKANKATTLTVKLPKAALSALKAGKRESVTFTLSASNPSGSATSRVASTRLRLVKLH